MVFWGKWGKAFKTTEIQIFSFELSKMVLKLPQGQNRMFWAVKNDIYLFGNFWSEEVETVF